MLKWGIATFAILLASGAVADSPYNYIDVQQADLERYATGALPDEEDRYRSVPETGLYRDFLPASTNLSNRFPTPGSQGRHGSCVAWAVGYAARSYYSQTLENRPLSNSSNIPSPAYIYHSIRMGTCEEGSRVMDALALLEDGAVSLQAMPYTDRSCPIISPHQRAGATDFRIRGYRRVDYTNLDQIKAQLAGGNPVIFAFSRVPRSFHLASGSRTYDWEGTEPEDRSGHAMTLVGYDETRQAFRLINSWGRDWGDRGFLWVGYDTFRQLAYQAFVMEPIGGVAPLPEPRPRPAPALLDLPETRCSSIRVEGDVTSPVIAGYVGYNADLEKLQAFATEKRADLRVDLRPWPQCEALETLADLLDEPERPEISLPTTDATGAFAEGGLLPVTVETTPRPRYLYVSYFQADGSVITLEQPDGLVPTPQPGATKLRFGDGENGNSRFIVSRPFGHEMIVSIASAAPLFEDPLPRQQTFREYLTAVRAAVLADADVLREGRDVSASVAFFKTREQ